MKFLCLMGLFPKEYEKTIAEDSLCELQYAADKLQWAIVRGLTQQENAEVTLLNALFIGSYPRGYRKMRIPSFPFGKEQHIAGENIGFVNLPAIKQLTKYVGVRKKAEAWIRSNLNEEMVIIAYAMTSPWVELLHDLSAKYPQVKTLLVVPDLPEYMDVGNTSSLYHFLKKRHISHMKKQLGGVDGYIFLTDHMKDWFDVPVNYTVVEGVYGQTAETAQEEQPREKAMLYAGGLCEEYGVLALAEAFRKLEAPDWKLELIGDGELMPRLKQMAKEDPRIVLRGRMPNDQVVRRQKQVSLLVNPRPGDQLFTKYSFPSKTIEYMASGTPMLGYRLPGIPEEYWEFFYEIPPCDGGLGIALDQVIRYSQENRDAQGSRAREFIINNKNAKNQCLKIVRLAEGIK